MHTLFLTDFDVRSTTFYHIQCVPKLAIIRRKGEVSLLVCVFEFVELSTSGSFLTSFWQSHMILEGACGEKIRDVIVHFSEKNFEKYKVFLKTCALQYIFYIELHYITLHCITLHYITLYHITLYHITLHNITLHIITLHCITLHYISVGRDMEPENPLL